jgi:hypothetical protein
MLIVFGCHCLVVAGMLAEPTIVETMAIVMLASLTEACKPSLLQFSKNRSKAALFNYPPPPFVDKRI